MSPRRRKRNQTDPELEARRAEVRRIVDEVEETAPPAPVAAPPDVSALVRLELERARQAEAERAEQAELDRLAHPKRSGCTFCGTGWCAVVDDDGTRTPGWFHHDDHVVCVRCHRSYFEPVGMVDDERRVRAIIDVLGLGRVPWAAELHPDRFRNVRVLFSEHPGATPSFEQWAHVDRDRLRTEWESALSPPVPAPAPLERHAPCSSCGCTDRWAPHEMPNSVDGGTFTTRRCLGCNVAPGTGLIDVDELVSRLAFEVTGRRFVSGIAAALDLKLWEHAARRRPPTEPFGWWGDVAAKARTKWPTRADFDAWYSETHSTRLMRSGWVTSS